MYFREVEYLVAWASVIIREFLRRYCESIQLDDISASIVARVPDSTSSGIVRRSHPIVTLWPHLAEVGHSHEKTLHRDLFS